MMEIYSATALQQHDKFKWLQLGSQFSLSHRHFAQFVVKIPVFTAFCCNLKVENVFSSIQMQGKKKIKEGQSNFCFLEFNI